MDKILVYADGAYRGKAGGVGSYGYVVSEGSNKLREYHGILLKEGITNNSAEYLAVIKALDWLKTSDLEFEEMVIRSDSQLLVKQLNGEWSVKSDNLKDLWKEAKEFIFFFEDRSITIKIEHVSREKNQRADELSQLAIEDHLLAKKLKGEEKKVCPECGKEMVVRDGQYGKFWGCSGYPECEYTVEYEDD